MSSLGYAGDSFWAGVGWLDSQTLAGEIFNRKLQLVYIHWTVLVAFLVVSVLAVAVLIRHRGELRRIMRSWVVACLVLYSAGAGLFFFNSLFFSHAMLAWPSRMFVLSMLRSAVVSVAPIWLLYVMDAANREMAAIPMRVYLALIPILHSVMAVLYLSNPHCAIE
jgi:hypothetical protein